MDLFEPTWGNVDVVGCGAGPVPPHPLPQAWLVQPNAEAPIVDPAALDHAGRLFDRKPGTTPELEHLEAPRPTFATLPIPGGRRPAGRVWHFWVFLLQHGSIICSKSPSHGLSDFSMRCFFLSQ